MFDSKSFEREEKILSIVKNNYEAILDEHHISCRPQNLIDWVKVVKEELNYLYFIDAVIIEEDQSPFDYQLDVLVANLESHQRLHLHVQFNKDEVIPSFISYYPAAEYALREQLDLYDFKMDQVCTSLFTSKNNTGPFHPPKLSYNPNKSESPHPEESWRVSYNEIYSAKTLGKFEAYYCFDPVKLVDLKIRLGGFFKGIEERLKNKEHKNIPYLLEQINSLSSPFFSGPWIINVERMLDIRITERAMGIRILIWELSRIAEHLFVSYETCHLLNLREASFFLDAYERVCDLFSLLSKDRHGRGMMRVGGMNSDIPPGWSNEFQEFNKIFLKNLYIYHQLLLSNKKFRSLLTHSIVSPHTVLQYGISGPSLRAAGINYDIRKSRSLYFYQDVDFDVPVGVHGTSFDRYLIRFEEIVQSSRIIVQVLDNLPLGKVNLGITDEEWKEELNKQPSGVHYFSLEGPNGEVGILHAHGKNARIERLKIKAPSLFLCQGIKEFLKGTPEDYLPVALASLGIREWEMER